jgi:hypothetical protein
MPTLPTQEQIDDVLNRCAEIADEGGTMYPGMTYEQGVAAGIRWASGDDQTNPLE